MRRYAGAIGGLVTFLVLLRLSWGCYAEHALQQAIAEHRAKGEPVFPPDFVLRKVADNVNAATYLKRAMEAYAAQDPSLSDFTDDLLHDPTLIAEQPLQSAKHLAKFESVFEQIRWSAGRRECEWGIAPDRNNLAINSFPHLRAITKLLAVAAFDAHLSNDDVAALQRIRELTRVARQTGRYGTIISLLVELAQFGLATSAIEFIAPELGARADRSAILRTQAEALINVLLDESYIWDAWNRAMLSERAYYLELLLDYVENPAATDPMTAVPVSPGRRAWNWLDKPAWQLLLARSMGEYSALASLRDNRDWSIVAREFPEPRLMRAALVGHPALFECLNPASEKRSIRIAGVLIGRQIAQNRMAAIAIAIRLYVIDLGTGPQALEDLVPKYLPSVPIDPCDPQRGPIRYRPSPFRPVLYSLGRNEIDDSPTWIDVPDRQDGPNTFRRYKSSRDDEIFELKRENIARGRWNFAASQPGQAVQNDSEKQDEKNRDDQPDGGDDQP